MALELIHLRKLLKLMYLTPNRQIAEIRGDIRQDIAREQGVAGGGGDFYGPFWADAREHVFDRADLHDSTRERVENNWRRERLYPRLRDGFLEWWNVRRRWTNEPFQQIEAPHARYRVNGLGMIKVENILAVRDGLGVSHYVYPYFSEAPLLTEEAARLALWVIHASLPQLPVEEIRILDVLRGRTFSLDRTPFQGNEEQILRQRYHELLRERDRLRREY